MSQQTPTEVSTPAVLWCDGDWKISPHGPEKPDQDCFWVATWSEVLEAVAELGGVTDDGSDF